MHHQKSSTFDIDVFLKKIFFKKNLNLKLEAKWVFISLPRE